MKEIVNMCKVWLQDNLSTMEEREISKIFTYSGKISMGFYAGVMAERNRIDCPECGGNKVIPIDNGKEIIRYDTCPKCNGTGKIKDKINQDNGAYNEWLTGNADRGINKEMLKHLQTIYAALYTEEVDRYISRNALRTIIARAEQKSKG